MITLISSTNRKNSYTKKVAEVYLHLMNKEKIDSQIFDLAEIPNNFLTINSYGKISEDFELMSNKYLKNVNKYIIICPEYNGSIPGFLKIIIDYSDYSIYQSKKVSIVGISSGHSGNLRGIDHLTSIFNHLGSDVFSLQPKLSKIQESFKNENLINKNYLDLIKRHIKLFINY
tara:strand:+ start:186 stop:704 length:519 start_codon:yes stop_codon:yes gene_type:complete